LGGDEFVVLCIGVRPGEHTALAERLVTEVARPIPIAGEREISITVSCGLVPLDSVATPANLLDAADAAMYRAKDDGRNRASR
jgi:diguanylate cyclase (GGDEF)-like protein